MEILTINDHLSFVLEDTRKGYKITCVYDSVSIGVKPPCKHVRCITRFIAEMTLAAEQMHTFEKVFDKTKNQN